MFDQAVLSERPSPGRCYGAAIGIAAELALTGGILIAPLIWPQLPPRPSLLTWLSLPAFPRPAVTTLPPSHVRPVVRPWQMMESKLIAPVAIPAKTALVDDPPPSPSAAESGTARASLGGDVMTMLSPSVFVPPPIQSVTAQAVPATKPVATEPPRYKVGGVVHMARLMHRVEPLYPAIARQARISGAVELRGVIGIDGRIRELQVVSGHPFLVKAALEAVRQWIYEPTLLNGDPVEVVAPITVTFHLI